MASTETGALLSSDTTEPVTVSTKRWTQVGFGAAAIAVLVSVFSGKDGILPSLIFVALCIGLAYVGYRYLVMGKVPADLGLAYVACGMWPLLVSYFVITLVWGLLLLYGGGAIVGAWNPLWLRNIYAAGKDLSGHGEVLIDGAPLQSAMASLAHAVHHHAAQRHHLALPHATVRIACAAPTVMRAALRTKTIAHPFRMRETDTMPSLTFEDGTKAGPLIATLVRAIGGVPYSFLIFSGLLYVIVLSYALQALVYAFTLRPLRRSGSTVVSVVACSRAIIIGFMALAFVIRNMSNFFVFILFVVSALFELGLCTMISLRAYANDHAVLEPERKPVLIEPVLLQAVYSFFPFIGIYIFFKNAAPILANIVEQNVLPREGAMQIAKWFIAIPIAFLPQIGLAAYAVWVARKRYNEATSVI